MPVGYTVVKQWQGVNLTDDPRSIADNELLWAANCYPSTKGIAAPRLRQSRYGAWAAAGTSTVVEDGLSTTLFDWVDKYGARRFLAWSPVLKRYVVLNERLLDEKYVERPDAVSLDFMKGVPRPGSLVYNNELFLFPGTQYAGLILGADDLNAGASIDAKFRELGTTWAAFTGAVNERPKFSFGDVYRDIFVLGGLGPPYESLLFFTQGIDSAGAPQPAWYTLLSAAKSAGFGFGDGDRLINFKTTPVTGGASAIEPYGIAFKRRSIWMLQGDVPTTTDSGTLVVTPVMRGEGLISSHAVCVTPYGIIWCSGRNVWLMPPGQKPVSIGEKIKGYLSRLPQNDSPAWFIAFADDVLYLNTPSARSGKNGETVAGTSLLYPQTEQWWCDLRNPDEPRWWGPQDVKAAHMVAMTSQQGPLAMAGITAHILGSTDTITAWELSDSNPVLRSYAPGAGSVVRASNVVTATIGANTLRVGDSVSLTLSGGDLGNFTTSGLVLTGRTATTISWAETAADYTNVAAVTIESTADYGNDLDDVGISAGEGGVNPSTHQIVRTKEMEFGDPMLTKILECIEVNSAWNPELSFGAGTGPWTVNALADGGAVSAAESGEVQTARGVSAPTSGTEAGTGQTGFALDLDVLDADGVAGGSVPLFSRFVAAPVFPRNSTRFLFRSLMVEMYSVLDASGGGGVFPRDYIRRRWSLQSFGFRVRPIGRRPGGSLT